MAYELVMFQWPDGICRGGHAVLVLHLSKTIQFQDINYHRSPKIAGTRQLIWILRAGKDLLNYFDSSCEIQFQLSFFEPDRDGKI